MRAWSLAVLAGAAAAAAPRVILVVLADDIGYAQAGWIPGSPASTGARNGTSLTPRLDALARDGLVLGAHYTSFWCTPSRVALLTGRLPVHAQMQQSFPESPSQGIPRNFTALPAYFTTAGWQTAAVGKCVAGRRGARTRAARATGSLLTRAPPRAPARAPPLVGRGHGDA